MQGMTIGELYAPAMKVTTQAEADAYFERMVSIVQEDGKPREEAERIVRSNLGYYAGYYDNATRARVERLFGCAHPIFGSIAQNGEPTAEDAFKLGFEAGSKSLE